LISFCKLEEVILQIKFFTYTNKSLINIHVKVYLDPLIYKLFLKLQQNMVISL